MTTEYRYIHVVDLDRCFAEKGWSTLIPSDCKSDFCVQVTYHGYFMLVYHQFLYNKTIPNDNVSQNELLF